MCRMKERRFHLSNGYVTIVAHEFVRLVSAFPRVLQGVFRFRLILYIHVYTCPLANPQAGMDRPDSIPRFNHLPVEGPRRTEPNAHLFPWKSRFTAGTSYHVNGARYRSQLNLTAITDSAPDPKRTSLDWINVCVYIYIYLCVYKKTHTRCTRME